MTLLMIYVTHKAFSDYMAFYSDEKECQKGGMPPR
jgi:hypothetical protein